MLVLGIESSCDDTAIAIIDADNREILAHIISSQIEIHKKYGGVIPELASRNHIEVIDKLILECLKQAKLEITDINLIAATGGPGLIGGVITSVMIAKAISLASNIPVIFVNHLEGHSLVARFTNPEIADDFLLFLASGGHCQILSCQGAGKYQKLGATIDDAIGESFDKVAKLLNLPYPGGPEIENLAKKGNEDKYKFPIALQKEKNCNFSLSGLKTAVRTVVFKQKELSKEIVVDIAASFQKAVTKQILLKLENAMAIYQKGICLSSTKKQLVFTGGVAANNYIRNNINFLAKKNDFEVFYPKKELCTDNGVMIAWAGYELFKKGNVSDLKFVPKARWNLF